HIHPLSGVLSAYGIGLADVHALRQKTVEKRFDSSTLKELVDIADSLERDVRAELCAQEIAAAGQRCMTRVHMRYQGTDTALPVPLASLEEMECAFEAAHRSRFGFIDPDRALMVEAIEVEARGGGADAHEPDLPAAGPLPPAHAATQIFSGGAWHETRVWLRGQLGPGHVIPGPALIIEPNQTVVVEPQWQASVTAKNHLLLTRTQPRPQREAVGTRADPVMLEVFNNLFMSIAEQMGVTLQNTAYSVNIKERLDFSCAVFDANGHLVANAPHMPVHLGSMDRSVETVIRENAGSLRPGDVYMINAPYNGGTHLPDITVVTPVFDTAGKEILFYVASRGHHADVGGITPGSMSPNATTIEQEGVYIDNFKLVEDGRFREQAVRDLLTTAPYPARSPDDNIADLKAQIAANEKGVQELRKMVDHFGLATVQAYMGHVQDNAEESVRRVIDVLRDSRFEVAMDQGTNVCVEIRVDRQNRSAEVDFTGTSPAQPN
ncbi:MAG: 5-oxoprolinase, partial [Alphaproteobacteria bacterium]